MGGGLIMEMYRMHIQDALMWRQVRIRRLGERLQHTQRSCTTMHSRHGGRCLSTRSKNLTSGVLGNLKGMRHGQTLCPNSRLHHQTNREQSSFQHGSRRGDNVPPQMATSTVRARGNQSERPSISRYCILRQMDPNLVGILAKSD